jgi:hypothetical protein
MKMDKKGQIDGNPLALPILGIVLILLGLSFMNDLEMALGGKALVIAGISCIVFFGVLELYDYNSVTEKEAIRMESKKSYTAQEILANIPTEEQMFNETKEMFHKMTDEQLRLATFDLWWKLHHLKMEVMEQRVNSKSWWQKWRELRKYDKERKSRKER